MISYLALLPVYFHREPLFSQMLDVSKAQKWGTECYLIDTGLFV